MRIALVHSFYRSTIPSGENITVLAQAKALVDAGHEVKMFSRHSDELMTRRLYKFEAAARIATGFGEGPNAEITRFSPDVIHVHNLFPNWGTSWMNKLDIPMVATVHNFRPICAAGTLTREGKFCDLCPTKGSIHSVKNSCYRDSPVKTVPLALASRKGKTPATFHHSNALIFLSDRSKALYEKYGLAFPQKAHVLPNFANAHPLSVQPQPPLSEGYWIFVGRLSPEKGIVRLIQSWPQHLGLRVVGSGPDAQICRQAATGKNIFFHGQLARPEVSELLKSANGLVFPSSCPENSPLVYAEALALGLPVVALSGNAVADDIILGGTGKVVESATSFPRAIEEIGQDYSHYREAAHKRFFEKFTQEVWTRDIEKIYRSVVL